MRTILKQGRLAAALPLALLLTLSAGLTQSSPAAPMVRQAGPAKKVSAAEAQERAAQEAETAALDLAVVATRLEALAKEATLTARDARARAIEADRRAKAARKRANLAKPRTGAKETGLGKVPGSILRGAEQREARKELEGEGVVKKVPRSTDRAPRSQPKKAAPQEGGQKGGQQSGLPAGQPSGQLAGQKPAPRAMPVEKDKHAAASRTAEENKAFYFGVKRAQHDAGPPKTLRQETMTFNPGAAPDMADLEVRAKWQWAINVARGRDSFQGKEAAKLSKTGHVDLARLLIGPAKNTPDHGGMKWGLRRYNLGDSTVVDCDFENIKLEHGLYDNLSGHGLYSGNTFHHMGGQAMQVAYRDKKYEQYPADNLSFSGKPLLIVEDSHAVDCGEHAGKSGFAWTFFDYGTHEYPSTLILRNCTSVHAWDFARMQGSEKRVAASNPQSLRAPGGMMVHQYQHSKNKKPGEQTSYTNEYVVIDNCLFDHTQNSNPVVAIRGTETILIEDSCFISRNGRGAFVDIDDVAGSPSGRVIIENCVSPKGAEVFLRVRKKNVMSMNCPGQRIEIDLNTMKRTVSEPVDDAVTMLQSPLRDRRPPSGITDQPLGHSDDIAETQARLRSQRAAGDGPR